MLQTTSETIRKRASEKIGDIEYQVDYSVTNDVLNSTECKVYKKTTTQVKDPEGNVHETPIVEFLGDITMKDGVISCSGFKQCESVSVHMKQFEAYLVEIIPAVNTK